MPTRRSHTTPNAIRIRTYADLRPWLLGFRYGKFHLLFLVGTPGLGKSRLIRETLAGRDHLMVEGHATALKTYAELYRHRDRPVVIDDEDSFHADAQKVRLMKCLCTTESTKRLVWQSTTKLLGEMDLPPAFDTASKVAVLANHLSATNPHVAALFDRGCVLSFEPSAGEVHDRVADWFTDREVHAFFGRWLPVIPAPSMRLYVKAAEMKAAGIGWRAVLMGQWKAGRVWRVEAVQADPELRTEEARVAAFAAAGWGSRATYFRHLDRWRKAVGARPSPTAHSPDIRPSRLGYGGETLRPGRPGLKVSPPRSLASRGRPGERDLEEVGNARGLRGDSFSTVQPPTTIRPMTAGPRSRGTWRR